MVIAIQPIDSYSDVCYVIKVITQNSVFHKQPGKGNSGTDLPDLIANSDTSLAKEVCLIEFINSS